MSETEDSSDSDSSLETWERTDGPTAADILAEIPQMPTRRVVRGPGHTMFRPQPPYANAPGGGRSFSEVFWQTVRELRTRDGCGVTIRDVQAGEDIPRAEPEHTFEEGFGQRPPLISPSFVQSLSNRLDELQTPDP